MFMFVGGEVKHIAFAVGGAILFSGTYSMDFNIIFTYAWFIHAWFVEFFMLNATDQKYSL